MFSQNVDFYDKIFSKYLENVNNIEVQSFYLIMSSIQTPGGSYHCLWEDTLETAFLVSFICLLDTVKSHWI